ncbi:MAG TPA: adventurous gliding motility protein GltG [Anaeromyxobacteraceae bacterium]|nr:adventurous gliding motility protein GltG [Anaeromyxobacteraceae bacterium]
MPISVTLKVYRGDELLRTARFSRDIIKIGRLSSAHLCLEDDRISRIHSVIEISADGLISIIDMGSAEGTLVNGRRVSKGPLRDGDEIKLGGIRLVLEEGSESASSLPVNGAIGVGARGAPAAANGPADPASEKRQPGPAGQAVAVKAAAGAALAAAAAESLPAEAVERPARVRPSLALARPVDEEPIEPGAADLGVEIRVLWGDTLLDAHTFVAPKEPVMVGEGPRCHFRLSGPALPLAEFPILRCEEGEYRFVFAQGMAGGVEEGGAGRGLKTFGELVQSRAASPDVDVEQAFSVPMPRGGAIRAEFGSGLRVEASFRRPPKPATVPWWEKLDHRYLNLLLVLLFLQGGFTVIAETTTRDVDIVQDDLTKGQQRMAKFVMKAPAEQPKQNKWLEKLKSDLAKQAPGEMAERHKGEEGQMGKRDAPKTNGRSAPRAIDVNAKELVKNSGLLGAIGRGKGLGGGLSTVFGKGGLGGDIKGAIGNMFGPVVGDSRGVGGLGLKGTGMGGGGAGETIGIGAVGTKGRGGGLGGSGYGSGVGGLGAKRDRDVAVYTGETKVLGAIDPELIRKVIRDHADQVRYCYEQQLTLNPKLTGKVAIRWQINSNGFSSNTMIDRTNTTPDAALERVADCIMSRIVTWEFPKPKGGGMAIVTYPWILRSSGSSASGG